MIGIANIGEYTVFVVFYLLTCIGVRLTGKKLQVIFLAQLTFWYRSIRLGKARIHWCKRSYCSHRRQLLEMTSSSLSFPFSSPPSPFFSPPFPPSSHLVPPFLPLSLPLPCPLSSCLSPYPFPFPSKSS